MYLTHKGIVDELTQYECNSVPQVKNKINELTKTKSVNEDWKVLLMMQKKYITRLWK